MSSKEHRIRTHIQNLFYPWHIQNPDIFKSSTVLDPCQTYCSALGKYFQAIIIFTRNSFLDLFRCLAGFSICLCIYKWYLACTVNLGSVSGIFRHIQALFKSILTTHIQNLVYPCQIQNLRMFRLQGIFIIPHFHKSSILDVWYSSECPFSIDAIWLLE